MLHLLLLGVNQNYQPIHNSSVKSKIAIIGFGNIAKAIITPLLDKKIVQPENIYCVVKSEKSLQNIKENYKHKINVYESSSRLKNNLGLSS